MRSICVLQDHYDDERYKTQHTTQQQTYKTNTNAKTTASKTKTKTDFWSQNSLILRPTVSDHITGIVNQFATPIVNR